jgi:hypothetical protein
MWSWRQLFPGDDATPHVSAGGGPTVMCDLSIWAFHLYDDTAAVIGLHVAAATLTEEKDVRAIRELFDQLAAVAVWGDEARAVIERVRASLM